MGNVAALYSPAVLIRSSSAPAGGTDSVSRYVHYVTAAFFPYLLVFSLHPSLPYFEPQIASSNSQTKIMLRKSFISVVAMYLCLCVACLPQSCSAKVIYDVHLAGNTLQERRLTPIALPALAMLLEVVQDAELSTAVKKSIADAGTKEKQLDVCRSGVLACRPVGDGLAVDTIVIDSLEGGTIRFAKIPASVTRLIVRNSRVQQMFALSDLPSHVTHFESHHSTWSRTRTLAFASEAGAAQPAVLALRNLTITGGQFINVSAHGHECGAAGCFAKFIPSLELFEMAENADLKGLEVDPLPVGLKSLTLSKLKSWEPQASVTVETILKRFPHLERLVIDAVPVPFSVRHLASTPSLMESLIISGLTPPPTGAEDSAALGDALAKVTKSLRTVAVAGCGLTGGIPPLAQSSLTTLDLSRNALTSLTFAQLPGQLVTLNVSRNLFSGLPPPLAELPATLAELDISHNALTGPLDVSKIPPSIAYIGVNDNKFSGPVQTPLLSEAARFVYLQNNKFTGHADLSDLPPLIKRILIYGNDWENALPRL